MSWLDVQEEILTVPPCYTGVVPELMAEGIELKIPVFSEEGHPVVRPSFVDADLPEPVVSRLLHPATRPRVLVVSYGPPDFDRHAGSFRFYSMLQVLSRHYDIIFFSPPPPLSGSFDSRFQRYADALRSLGIDVHVGLPVLFASLLERADHGVLFEFFHSAEWALAYTRVHRPDLPIVVDSVDLAYLRQLRGATYAKHRWAARLTAARTKYRELGTYRRSDVVIVVTQDDRKALLDAFPDLRVAILPTIHPVNEPVSDVQERIPHSLLFVGGFQHNPNLDAVLWFCKSILPLIRDALPDVTLTVVGDSAPAAVRELAGARVNIAGWVPDITSHLRSHSVSIAPLRFGSGMKGKIGEAMASGLPVVTTTIGAEGMGLQHDVTALIADSPHEFAAAVVRLCSDPDLHTNISRRGLEHVKQNWDVGVVERHLLDIFASLPSLPPKRATVRDRLAAQAWLPYDRMSRRLARMASVLQWYLSRVRRHA